MSAIEDELAEVFGSPEAVQRHIAFMREQVNIGGALWNVPPMPMDRRLSVLAERLRMLAELLRSGEVDKIELNARRDLLDLDALADILDPAIDNGDQKLVFTRRRAGNPKAAMGEMGRIECLIISMECGRLYDEWIGEGRNPRGLKKLVSDAIGKRVGKKGATIDKMWRVDTDWTGRKRRVGRATG
jgi:hypothetical protein